MKTILFGAPDVGKGTQAEVICERLSTPTTSTGTVAREALKSGIEMGRKARSYMEAGQSVPDEIAIGTIEGGLVKGNCENGFIPDGSPRTIARAEALGKIGFPIDKVIDIEVIDENIVVRISGYRVCNNCGVIYHVRYRPSKVKGACDKCDDILFQHKDNQPEIVKERLGVYHKQAKPLKEYYQKQGKLFITEGEKHIVDTTCKTFTILEKVQSRLRLKQAASL